MKADHLTYQRAAAVSLWGLLIQLGLGLLLLVYAILGRDHAALSASIFVLVGVAAWLTLAIVFDQHRRERLEALEAETLDAQSARDASAFSAATDVRVQALRLESMHRWLVPVMSVAMALALLGLGFVRLRSGLEHIGYDKANVDQFVKPTDRGWAIAVGISLAVIGFVFARFVSGMAKQKVWANLRGGAVYAVGASLIGVAMLVGQLFDIGQIDVVLRYLQVVIPGFLILIGGEIFVSLLLNQYRPRRPGEVPRPAFDSPILSFVASPDRIAKTIGEAISYQFGVDVTGSWAYRLVSRYVPMLILVGGGVLWVLTCFAVVDGDERGLRIRNGRLIEEVGPGLYVKAPWPFEVIETRTVAANIGPDGRPGIELTNARPGDNLGVILWTDKHSEGETYNIVQSSMGRAGGAGGASGTGTSTPGGLTGLSLIKTEIPLTYTVEDLQRFDALAAPEHRDDYLRAVAQREVWPLLASLSEGELLGPKRSASSEELARRVSGALRQAGAGVNVVSTGIEAVHPPRETAAQYEAVVTATIQSQRVVQAARTDEIRRLAAAAGSVEKAQHIIDEISRRDAMANAGAKAEEIEAQERVIDELITGAGGEAGQLLATARTERWTKLMGERGRSEAYTGQLAAYEANKAYYRVSRYLDALADAMKNSRVYIVPTNVGNTWMQVDLQDKGAGGNVFKAGETGGGG